MTAISSTTSLTLDLPPSCIQFSPRHPELFVVGTYFLHGREQQGNLSTDITQLSSDASVDNEDNPVDDTTDPTPAQPQAQKRTGSLSLFKLENDQITQLASTATDFAILDIQWAIHPDPFGDLLAVATSTGLLAFYHLRISAKPSSSELVLSSVHAITKPEILVLSLTWHPTRADTLGATLSDGSVQLCECTPGGRCKLWDQGAVLLTTELHRHELEAWTLTFTPGKTAKVLSGGDDAALQCSHISSSTEEPSLLWRDRKLHEAGVTAILPLSGTLIVTGSYDDHIRLISIPSVGRRQVLAETNLDGGVWRLKILRTEVVGEPEGATKGTADPHPDPDPDPDPTKAFPSSPSALSSANANPASMHGSTHSILLLCSCMHAGTRIVRLSRGTSEAESWEFEVLGKFEEHQSMNYGSDVQPGTKSVVSTSFYDKLMCLWTVDGLI
ncbi:hypothetical protein DOTSEDRAFT_54538 [Dothistroma septosporum NZE10]|uniref:Anaphase-promoting complex subunit 4 WD40 domain-containing protein n=1 Tax=Dothistroma septosporum (strain NZE10 / CBS 128990) TaxID=675120 RepID=N1PL91_DOTSN|nr:hypothetical protein DOTSEDRAFT_54538 [Dothistroma septosporum NZE10]